MVQKACKFLDILGYKKRVQKALYVNINKCTKGWN
nr:MAG TPA: hypothetical protein [Caudoviricetes sp.]